MSDADARGFAKSFEPILLFHEDEQFSPIDPKWYLERSALWLADPRYDDKTNWGEPPRTLYPRLPHFNRNTIAAVKGEPGVWIGEPSQKVGVGLAPTPGNQAPAGDEFFLDFAGWDPPVAVSSEVTATSTNRHAALTPADYAAPLAGSSPWYYVEYLTNQELLTFTSNRSPNGLDLFRLVANNDRLSSPHVLVYHFFYPFHQESLRGCNKGDGPVFGSYAGEWASIAILLDSANHPRFIGLTSRNAGDPMAITAGEEPRVGMIVQAWSDLTKASVVNTGQGAHPKIFVSLGTHGCYLSTGTHAVASYTPGIDSSGGSCGTVESLDEAISEDEEIITDPGKPFPDPIVIYLKAASVILIPWALVEGFSGEFGSAEDVSPGPPMDETGGPAAFGKIIRPAGLDFEEAHKASSVVDWNVNPLTRPDGRSYDFVIDRTTQVWWAPRTDSPGFSGRWGPRVTNDPKTRRCGMKLPDFLLMFLEGIAVAMNKK